MPEGDTIFLAAATLQRVLAGEAVARFDSVFPALKRIADPQAIVGRTIDSVTARGKHLLIAFSGGLTLRTHMRMNGAWHVYPLGARWRRPAREARIVIETPRAVAVAFNVYVAELLTARELARHAALRSLGPDLLAPDFDASEASRRIRARGADAIADVLLDQRVLAGIGNVFKSEVLFIARVDPFAPVSRLSAAQIDAIVTIARDALATSVRVGRRTTRATLDPRERLWVYGRGGKPCRRCGGAIASRKTGADARLTYWCPHCQPALQSRA